MDAGPSTNLGNSIRSIRLSNHRLTKEAGNRGTKGGIAGGAGKSFRRIFLQSGFA